MKAAVLGLMLAGLAGASTAASWEMSTFADFIKGKFDGVSLGRDGRLSLAPKLDTLFTSEQPVIWSVAAAPDGSLYAATGHRGRVFRIDQSGTARLIWTATRPEVFAIAVDKRGVLYAASSPDGKIYRIENGNATEYFDPKAKYIWALALAPDGVLYAGTGDGGKVFRITGPGQGAEYYATGQGNVTGLMIDAQGRLLAGTEPNGILYRITAKDKAFALYDSTLPEIRAIASNADGSVYAVGLGGALAKKVQAAQQTNQTITDASGAATTTITVTAAAGGDLKPNPPEPQKPQQAVPVAATPAVAAAVVDLTGVEKSAIYRINSDNTVDTVWSSKEENVYDILPSEDGGLYFGTDQNGRVYSLTRDHKLTLLAQTNEAETTRLLRWNGAMLAATANMGKIYRLNGSGSKGTYESPVFDAGGVARWGKLRWQGENGAGSVALRTRSGNSIRPDNTWSDWSGPVSEASGVQIASPNARYLQFEADLTGAGALIDNVSAAYLPQNNPPMVRSVTVLTQPVSGVPNKAAQSTSTAGAASAPFSVTVTDTGDAAPVTSTGTPTQTLSRAAAQQMLISWQADDPDNDKLVYELDFRGDGERDWKPLRRNLHDNTFTIDGDALADGRYFFRVKASDREANPASSAKDAELISSPVLIDNTPPVIRVTASSRTEIAFEAQDAASVLRRAEWSMDAGPWTPVEPVDGVLDSRTEQFRLHLENIPSGEHVVVLRVADSGNNTGSREGDSALKIGGQKTLERVLSKAGIGSRAQARSWIHAGRVRVNGRVVENPDHWVDFKRDKVEFDGKPLQARDRVYILLYKPTGYITSFGDPEGRPTVYDLIAEVETFVAPVGRLDLDTSGLLILTNDTQFAERLTNPDHHIAKTYLVKCAGLLSDEVLERLRTGVELSDGMTLPARVRRVRDSGRNSHVEMSITEGRNRQVRRMVEAVGSRVLKLVRTSIGGVGMGDLKIGKWRELTAREVAGFRG